MQLGVGAGRAPDQHFPVVGAPDHGPSIVCAPDDGRAINARDERDRPRDLAIRALADRSPDDVAAEPASTCHLEAVVAHLSDLQRVPHEIRCPSSDSSAPHMTPADHALASGVAGRL